MIFVFDFMKKANPPISFFAIFIISLFAASTALAQGSYPKARDLYVNDFAGLLTARDKKETRTALMNLRNETGVELSVVTIRSIRDYKTGDETLESFATNLFNTWGIGDRQKNDGALILVAARDRRVRIELGSGYGSSYTAQTQSVIDEQMIPHFKKQNFCQGILEGTNALIKILSERAATVTTTPTPVPPVSPVIAQTDQPGVAAGTIVGWAMVIAAAGLIIWLFLRLRPKRCTNCRAAMKRLDSSSENEFLDKGQRLEMSLGSVDYQVWHCARCNKNSLEAKPHWLSSFSTCHVCNYRTFETQVQTLVYPTQFSPGTEQRTVVCHHCDYRDERISILPMLPPPDYDIDRYNSNNSSSASSFISSSSDYSSSSFDSSSSSSFDSSGSSDSSFGGGSSSGDGSSGSW